MPKKAKAKTLMCRFDFDCPVSDGSNSNSKAPRLNNRSKGNTRVAKGYKKRTWVKIKAKFEIQERKLLLDIPIRTKSEANSFEPWRVKHGRHKEQQRLVALYLNPHKDLIKMPCKLMLTRFAPDFLDSFDNLPMSFKFIVDAVCSIITGNYVAGRADSDSRISIACDQVKSKEYGIRIEISW